LISLKRIKQIEINPRSKVFTLFVGNYQSAFKGRGVEVSDIRPYVPGDNVKYIDWNATAKSGDVYVKEFTETRELNIHFAIDNSSSMTLNEWGSKYTKRDIALKIVYLLGLASNYHHDKISASLYDKKLVTATEAKKGKVQLIHILKKLLHNSKSTFYNQIDLNSYLRFLTEKLSHRSVCIFFTDNIDVKHDATLKSLKAINLKHDLVVIDIYELIDADSEFFSNVTLEDIESGGSIRISKGALSNYNEFLLEEKRQIAKTLHKYNIDYLAISTKANLLKELIRFFKLKSSRHVYYS